MDGRLLKRYVVARSVNIFRVLPPAPVLKWVCMCMRMCYGHGDPGGRAF